MSKYFEKHKFYLTKKKLWIKFVYVALEDVLIHKSGIYVMPSFRNGGLLWKLPLSESGGRGWLSEWPLIQWKTVEFWGKINKETCVFENMGSFEADLFGKK